MKALLFAGVACSLAFFAKAACSATTFYVAKNGTDNWAGRLNAPNAARTDGPFASIEKARDAVRGLRRTSGLREPITVLVRGGVYAFDKSLVFTAEDSGTKECPITYRASPGEKVVLTGGRPVRGWRKHSGSIYVASLAEKGFDDFRFRELFFKGERQILARYPNYDPAHSVTGGLLYVEDTASSNRNSFHYKEGSIPFDKWKDLSQAEVNLHPYHCWDHNILRIAKVDTDLCLVRLRHNVAGSIFVGNRYFLQNVLEALDAPGEWFSDWKTGTVYFWPSTGKSPADGEVVVPVLENLVEFSATEDNPVQYLKFHGFTLKHARQDAIALEGAEHCAITGNTITQIGGVGVNVGYLRNAMKGVGLPWRKSGAARSPAHSGDRSLFFSYRCRECRVAGNDLYATGGEGIVLAGTKNTAENNHLYTTGIYDRVCAGLTIYGDENVASHNVIHDVPRDGIFINGKLNVAEYNDIRNSMLYTVDNAAIALRQHDVSQAVVNRGNALRFNRLLDTIGYGSYPHCTHPGDGFASPFCSFGIYLDGSICGVLVYGNIIARTGGDSVFIQFGGGNVVENNIFVEGEEKRIQFDSMIFFGTFMYADSEGSFRDKEPPNEIKHNLFCYGGPNTKLYQVGHWGNAPEWNRKQAVFDDNLIWRKGQPVAVNMHSKMDYKSLAEWQAQGYDTLSLVADPLFVDPKRDDYRLKPGSPAYKVGFKNINAEIERIGAYRSEDRASWPLQNTVLQREKPVVFEFSKEPLPIIDGFETTPLGFSPAKVHGPVEGTAQVTDKGSRTGNHCLEFIDAPGLKHVWEPHVFYNPNYRNGRIHCSVDLMNSKESPADFYLEFRDWEKELLVGPTFRVTRDGRFYVNGRLGAGGTQISQVPNGEWYTVTIQFTLGDNAPKEYTLKLSVQGEEDVVTTLPFGDTRFRNATWFGLSSTSAERTVFCVDNLILGSADSDKVKNAATSAAIKGTGKPEQKPTVALGNADKLVGYWKFDEDEVDLLDSSGNGLNGDLGGAQRARGEFGRAIYLDGSGGAATFPDSPLLQLGTDDFSIECWLYPVTLEVGSMHKRRRLIEAAGYPVTWWNVDLQTDGKVMMEMADQSTTSGTTVSSGAIPEKQWTHLVITVDRRNFKTSYYLNGKLDSTKNLPASFTGSLTVPGKPLSTGTWQQYIGMMDELRIHRRVLRDEEIRASYEKGKGRYVSGVYTVVSED